ncbi:MAG: type VI secretion system tube protein Hcp [Desulfobacterales bacterium]|nr:type VI secretion system tube protein Hcp [Desulfobacterales bacterium]
MANAIFMKIEGVDGECRESGHEDWIQINGISHNLAANIDRVAASGSGGHAVGATEHGDLLVTKVLDKSSLPIMSKCCAGQSFGTIEIEMMTATAGAEATPSQRFLSIVMNDVLISSVTYSDSSDQPGRPAESIGLNYKKIEWTYTPYDDSGSALGDITKYWDCKANTGG